MGPVKKTLRKKHSKITHLLNRVAVPQCQSFVALLFSLCIDPPHTLSELPSPCHGDLLGQS